MIHADLNLARDIWINEAMTDEERQRRTQSDFLKYQNSQGLFADFHGLRHTFILLLARSGVSPKVAQMLARHSTITLTLDLYTHILSDDQRGAINQLPAISPERTPLKPTDSDGESSTPNNH
jgi:site-specific recombinase XerD